MSTINSQHVSQLNIVASTNTTSTNLNIALPNDYIIILRTTKVYTSFL